MIRPRHAIDIWAECSSEGRVFATKTDVEVVTRKTMAEIEAIITTGPRVCPCKKPQRVCAGYEGPAR